MYFRCKQVSLFLSLSFSGKHRHNLLISFIYCYTYLFLILHFEAPSVHYASFVLKIKRYLAMDGSPFAERLIYEVVESRPARRFVLFLGGAQRNDLSWN